VKKKGLTQEIQQRRSHIAEADLLVTDGERLTSVPLQASEQAARDWRRAAKLYGTAATLYRQAGLGLQAITAWQAAAKCFQALGLSDDFNRCETSAKAIPHYWSDEPAASPPRQEPDCD
jgi:hypothetical protein